MNDGWWLRSTGVQDDPGQPIWTQAIIPAEPDAWVWLGDMAYLDHPVYTGDKAIASYNETQSLRKWWGGFVCLRVNMPLSPPPPNSLHTGMTHLFAFIILSGQSYIHPFINLFMFIHVHSFIHSSIYQFMHSVTIHSCTDWFIHPNIYACISFAGSLVYSLIESFDWLTQVICLPCIHSFHSLTFSLFILPHVCIHSLFTPTSPFIYLSIDLCIHPSKHHPSIHPSKHGPVDPSIHASTWFAHSLIHLLIHPFIRSLLRLKPLTRSLAQWLILFPNHTR